MIKRVSAFLASFALVAAALVGLGASPAQAAVTYYYAGVRQDLPAAKEASATGLYANIAAYAPSTEAGVANHSLGQLSVQNDGGKWGVAEAGWYVDNGGTVPHLFVSQHVNNVWGGSYTGTGDGFIKCSTSTTATTFNCGASMPVLSVGAALTSGSTYKIGIEHVPNGTSPGGWWVWASVGTGSACSGAQCWVGYYPDSLWSSIPSPTFDRVRFAQAFGEVSDAVAPNCSDMGNGTLATSTAGAAMGTLQYTGLPTTDVDFGTTVITNAAQYNAVTLGTAGNIRNFRYGGPGAC